VIESQLTDARRGATEWQKICWKQ